MYVPGVEPQQIRMPSIVWSHFIPEPESPLVLLSPTRHTHASLLLAAGVPPMDVAARLGDTLETVMSTYAHVIPRRGHLAAEEFQRIVSGGGGQ
jgi:hypothetical protein